MTPMLVRYRVYDISYFSGTVCPHCGGLKQPGRNLCAADYAALPMELQWNLYPRNGAVWKEAIHAALDWLEDHFPSGYEPPSVDEQE